MRVREENRLKSDSFDLARRSLRLWPVPGTDMDLMKEALRFIQEKLKVPDTVFRITDFERVRRMMAPKKSNVNHEVSVVFKTKIIRDGVSSYGRSLAQYKDDNGWPTAGLRLEYPAHLAQDFRCLEWYGREMRVSHGQGTRRNIKFDDEDESL